MREMISTVNHMEKIGIICPNSNENQQIKVSIMHYYIFLNIYDF